ncbi:MAG: thiamine pyrophosphate-binding protein [bacterium]
MNSANADKAAASSAAASGGWPAGVHRAFRAMDIRQVGYVPDSGLAGLIRLCEEDPGIAAVSLTSEEEGVGLAAGAWLGGQRSALLMQSSGVGNCLNAFALAAECGFPLLMLVTMRGEEGELNPWQFHMGRMAAPAIELAGGPSTAPRRKPPSCRRSSRPPGSFSKRPGSPPSSLRRS